MNLEDLKKLQTNSKKASVFYLEKDQKTKQMIQKLLENNFDEVFYSIDDTKAIDRYIKSKADLFIISLPLKNQNIIEFISNLQQKKQDCDFLIITPFNEDYELLKMLDFGFLKLIKKPFNLDSFVKELSEALDYLKNDLKNDQKRKSKNDKAKSILENIYKNKKTVNLYNSYKGIPITTEVIIENLDDNCVVLKVQPLQQSAIRYQGHTILYSEDDKEHIKLNVSRIDKTKNEILFCDFSLMEFFENEHRRFYLNNKNELQSSFFYQNEQIRVQPLEVSYDSILVYMDESEKILNIQSEVDIKLGFEIFKAASLTKETVFTKAFAKGKLVTSKVYKNGFLLEFDISIKKSDQSEFKKFLKNKESKIISEFKKLANNR